MLDLMRKHAQSWFIKVLLGGIVVTFVSWGGYSRYQQRSNTVAYINGEALGIQEYERTYSQTLEALRAQMRGQLDDATLKALNLRQRVYDQLLERMLMLQEAKRLGMSASEEELRQRIAATPAFQAGGQFNEEIYRRALAANNLTPAAFEEEQRLEVALDKLRRLISGFAKVSDAEAWAQWRQQNEKVSVAYASFAAKDFLPKVSISDADLAAYYAAHKEGFRKPARVKIGYVAFDVATLAKQLAPADKEVRAEYDKYRDDYYTPKEVKARHILLTVPQGAKPQQEQQIEQKALALLAEARSGGDFAELAKKYSQDPGSAPKGGDLGWFGEGTMVEEFQRAVFSLPKGSIGGPVRTQFGYHVIKVEDVREPRLRPFEEVRAQIADKIARERAEDAAQKRLADSFGQAAKAGNLKKFAASQGYAYQESELVAAGAAIPGLADSGRILAAAIDKKIGEMDSDANREAGPVIFQVIDRKESYVPPLAEVAADARQRMSAEKAVELASSAAARLLAEVKAGASFEAAAAKSGGKVGHAGPFQRGAAPVELGQPATEAAFKLTAAKPLAPTPYRSSSGFVALRLTGRIEPSEQDFAAQRQQAVQGMLAAKRQQIFDQWLKGLREKADIEVVNKIS